MSTLDYEGFVKALFAHGIDSWDGFELQELAVEHGLFRKEWTTVPCGENCSCNEVCVSGDVVECYRIVWREQERESSAGEIPK